MKRVAHVDMDAYFAAVEQRDNPHLRNKPIIVGSESKRGVVVTCSYEARKYGVHSAMPSYIAKKLCKECIFVRSNYKKYSELSKEIFQELSYFSDNIEKVSIDEGYLDLSESFLNSEYLGREIKKRIKEKFDLNISVGISYNKFLAKLASDWNKPDGLKIITEEMIPEILLPLDISKVHGLGKKSKQKLNNIGAFTIKDLYKYDLEFFESFFGKQGLFIYHAIRGIDNRKVNDRNVKNHSIGSENTLREDTKDREVLYNELESFSYRIEASLQRQNLYAKCITVKIKYNDFTSCTRSKTIQISTNKKEEIFNISKLLLNEFTLDKKVRLIGISVSNLEEGKYRQISLFEI